MLSILIIVGSVLSKVVLASAEVNVSSDSNSALFSNLTASVFSPSDPVKVYVGLQVYVVEGDVGAVIGAKPSPQTVVGVPPSWLTNTLVTSP